MPHMQYLVSYYLLLNALWRGHSSIAPVTMDTSGTEKKTQQIMLSTKNEKIAIVTLSTQRKPKFLCILKRDQNQSLGTHFDGELAERKRLELPFGIELGSNLNFCPVSPQQK